MGLTNKTDKLDAKGLAILLRDGTLPEVLIPPSQLHDQRDPLRLRVSLVRLHTRVKNRIHGTLSRHNVQGPGRTCSESTLGWSGNTRRAVPQGKYTVKVRMDSPSLSSEDTRPGRLSPSVRTEALWLKPSLIL